MISYQEEGEVTPLLIELRKIAERIEALPADEKPKIYSPGDAAQVARGTVQNWLQETLVVIGLSTRSQVMFAEELYRGNVESAALRTAEVFRTAIRQNAAAIIVAHTHPSGETSPSPDDVATTRHIRETGEMLDIPLLDHLIITPQRYLSLKEEGLGFA